MSLYTKGFVYVVWSRRVSAYKIGFTSNTKNRIEAIKTTLPDAEIIHSVETVSAFERWLHDRLAAKRIGREWFDLDKINLAWIKSGRALEEFAPFSHEWVMSASQNRSTKKRFYADCVRGITKCIHGRQIRWKINACINGKRVRRFFGSHSKAKAFADKANSDMSVFGLDYSESTKALKQIKNAGLTVAQVWDFYNENINKKS